MGKKNKHRVTPKDRTNKNRGFDLGDQQGVILLPDVSFASALHKAEVVGCAYALGGLTGYPGAVPWLSLVCRNAEPMRAAFKSFEKWGCEADGEVVDLQILLKKDGKYFLVISPEADRAIFRLGPHQLTRPLFLSQFWIKEYDTTNSFLHQLKSHCDSGLGPVVLSAATLPAKGAPLIPENIGRIEGLPSIIKFNIKIRTEEEDPNHWLVDPRAKRTRPPGGAGPASPKPSPREYAAARRRTIDTAFPVTRERIRRALLVDSIQAIPGFKTVGRSQIEQAAINLMLSVELCDGTPHYATLDEKYRDTIWKHIEDRVEYADGKSIPSLPSLDATCTQIRADITELVTRDGADLHQFKKFSSLQAFYDRRGYGAV
ncbi:MAG TPA: hypothetical protein VGO34_09950 [Alphaproteobacteria bacterium]